MKYIACNQNTSRDNLHEFDRAIHPMDHETPVHFQIMKIFNFNKVSFK